MMESMARFKIRTPMLLPVAVLFALDARSRPVEWSDLPDVIRAALPASPQSFPDLRRKLEAETERRVRRGEDEHLAYYVLQSRAFTRRPPIEPALARNTEARISAFLKALPRPSNDERMQWWQEHLPASRRSAAGIQAAIAEAASFLREKEFGIRGPEVYQKRGHSSDTSLAPGFTVWNALGVIRGLDPEAVLGKVLIVGPGLDFAPRTAMHDGVPPQTYQPFLLSEALPGASILSVDVNPRVVEFLKRPARPLILPEETGNAEYLEYLARLRPQRTVAARAELLNIVTQRLDEQFDLIVATNILVYFNRTELALAIANISSMLRSGGYLVHNEVRTELEELAGLVDLPVVQARTINIAQGTKAPLIDAAVIHRKGVRK